MTLTPVISQAEIIANASQSLMHCAHMLDRKADAAFDSAELDDLAAKRIQIEATARMIEGLLDDGGRFNGTLWHPDALRAHIEECQMEGEGARVAAEATAGSAGAGMVPLWL